jgi:hypothetical protein
VLDRLAEREPEVQVQLASTGHIGAELDRIRQIAVRAPSEKTKTLAIEAIGNSPDPRSQEVLLDLYKDFREISDREQVLTFVHPSKLEDRSSEFLYSVMSDSSASEAGRTRASVALITAAVRETGRVPESPDPALLSRVPGDFRPRFLEIYANFRAGGEDRH